MRRDLDILAEICLRTFPVKPCADPRFLTDTDYVYREGRVRMAFVFLAFEFGATTEEIARFCNLTRLSLVRSLHTMAVEMAEEQPVFARMLLRMAADFRMVQVYRFTVGDTHYSRAHLPQNLYQGYSRAM